MISSTMIAGKFVKTVAAVTVTMAVGLSSAHAFVLDTLLGSRNLANSGDATELAAIRQVTGNQTLTLGSKVDINGGNTPTLNPGTTNQYVIDVGTSNPGYFLLKFGTGNTGADDTYFFSNMVEPNKLVFSTAQLGNLAASFNIGRLSHYDIFGTATATPGATPPAGGVPSAGTPGGGSTSVPEPATLALLGLGMLGVAAARAKRKAK